MASRPPSTSGTDSGISPPASSARALAARVFEASAAASAGVCLARWVAGPLSFDVGSLSLTVRSPTRPLLIGAVCLVVRLVLAPRVRIDAAAAIAARVAIGAVLVGGVIGWLAYRSPVVGGADSYGYVSAAQRIVDGRLVQREPLAAVLPFGDAINAACPLGYVPAARVGDACAPAYPLGLPALMAIGLTLAGPSGPFAMAPAAGLVLLIAAWLIATAWYRDRLIALVGCALLAVHPLVVTYAIQPMSDVPAAALVTLSLAALCRPDPRWVVAGLLSGMALLVRPALAPAAVALLVVGVTAVGWGRWRLAWRYLVPVSAAVAVQAIAQWWLYGNPAASGYGPVTQLFSMGTVVANLRSHGYWAMLALGPWFWLAVVAGLRVTPRAGLVACGALTVTILGTYLLYRPFDHWETLRFLLPILVITTLAAAAGLVTVWRRLARETGGALLAAASVLSLAMAWTGWIESQQVLTMPAHEARHRLAGELVAQATPDSAVVLALQHSGSLRYYSGRTTLNWDRIPAGALAASVAALQARGLAVYLMIDSAEEQSRFDALHGAAGESWLPAGQRRDVQLFEARPVTAPVR